MGDPEFMGWVDSYVEGVGGGWIPGKDALEPTICFLKLTNKLQVRMVIPTNPGGDLDINDLKMVGKLLAWLMLEVIVGI